MHPRAYGTQFAMYAGTSVFFLQNQQDGGQPIAIFDLLDRSCDLLVMLVFHFFTIKLK